ncbi:MAG TPA: hypothetical protein VEF04_16000 [Blastocatellia bacterium]|nr:hypothetical protein [Blastocatellia bacterium]
MSDFRIGVGACVVVSLCDPREKFWGVIGEINAAGIWLRGIDVNSYEELLRTLARGEESIYPATVFFPLRRIERVLFDETAGEVPSLTARFEETTGRHLADYLGIAQVLDEAADDGVDETTPFQH